MVISDNVNQNDLDMFMDIHWDVSSLGPECKINKYSHRVGC